MKKYIFGIVLLLCTFTFSNSEEIIITFDIGRNFEFYKNVRRHYDRIELGYIKGETEFSSHQRTYFSINRINYYGYKRGSKYFLGYVDSSGVFDKDCKLIKEYIFESTDTHISMGLSSQMLDGPFSLCLIIKDLEMNELFNSDTCAYIRIEFSTDSLMVYEPEIW
jgi:hypothetical protein